MNGNIDLSRIAGIRVRIHWSLLVVFILIVWSLNSGVFPSQNPGHSDGAYLAMAVAAAVFLASILLNEFGHEASGDADIRSVRARRWQLHRRIRSPGLSTPDAQG